MVDLGSQNQELVLRPAMQNDRYQEILVHRAMCTFYLRTQLRRMQKGSESERRDRECSSNLRLV